MACLADSAPDRQTDKEVTYRNTKSLYTSNRGRKRTCVLDFLALALSGSSVSEAPFSRCRLALFIGEGASSLIFCGAQIWNITAHLSRSFFETRRYQRSEQRSTPPCWASSWTPSCCRCCLYWLHWERSVRWSANPHWLARLCHRDWLSASYDHYVALTSKQMNQHRHQNVGREEV